MAPEGDVIRLQPLCDCRRARRRLHELRDQDGLLLPLVALIRELGDYGDRVVQVVFGNRILRADPLDHALEGREEGADDVVFGPQHIGGRFHGMDLDTRGGPKRKAVWE